MIANLVLCVCMYALCGIVWAETATYPDFSRMSMVGPEAIPNLLGWIIAVLSTVVLLKEVVKIIKDKTYFANQTAGAKALAKDVWENKPGILRVVVVIGMMFLYASLLDTVGFEICSAVFLLVSMLICGIRNWKVLVLVPLGTIAVVYIVFVEALSVSVPMLFL